MGYVEDEETPEMIMKKFEALEAVRSVLREVNRGDRSGGTDKIAEQAAAFQRDAAAPGARGPARGRCRVPAADSWPGWRRVLVCFQSWRFCQFSRRSLDQFYTGTGAT